MEKMINEQIDSAMIPEYFDIIKYISSVEIEQGVLEHLAELQEQFDVYLKTLKKYGHNKALDYLLLSLYNELLYSNQIETDRVLSPIEMLDQQILIKKNNLTKSDICKLQKKILENTTCPYPTGEQRDEIVFVRKNNEIVYVAPQPSDVSKFMKRFIKFYNMSDDGLMHNDPFIKAALLHLLFVKIHPFIDGNGRVARTLHNQKFTSLVNNTYHTDFVLSPLNISSSLYINKDSYFSRLAQIDFKENADINFGVNRWLDFIIYMYEEQLYQSNKNMQKVGKVLSKLK